ncbi:cytoskeleton-associated protein 2-like [Kryptolebias marmoratus]|uniref:Cytoskeleton-associated protein 2-like n=1 Tax=Kryptolebias marmoratus TaxID=37003 RepID=A0A3Q2ZHS3_KRYMA|nr:cytoskeleton-associated protein 2-like [Kryptolebias marmoratus]
MEDGESAPMLSRKELRKQKLMEYLAAKGKLKPPIITSSLHQDRQVQKPVKSSIKVVTGKENEPSADTFKYKSSKSQTLTAQFSKDPLRRAFGISNTVNVRGGTLNRKENADRSFSSRASTQLKRNQNPFLTKTYTVVSSKPSVTAASTLKKPTNTRGQTSSKASSFAAKSNSNCSLSSNCASVQTAGSRLSIGPLVRTKTGLTPAVIQPRSTKTDLSHPCAPAHKTITTASVVGKKVRSSSTSSAPAPQRSAGVGSVNPRAGGKVQTESKSKPKPPQDKRSLPACKSQLSGGLRVTSTSCRLKAPSVKPEGRALTRKPAGPSADRPVKVTSGAEGEKKSQTSWRTNRCTSTAGSRLKPAVVTEPAGKTKTNTDTLSKKQTSSAKILPPQTATRRTVAPVICQTAPQPSRSVSITGRATDRKTPKVTAKVVPQTEGKKVTAAQEERLKKLQEWREARGISYKRPPMQVKTPVRRTVSVPQPFWASMKAEDEAHSLICAVDRSLADCIKLLAEGCPADQVKQIVSRLPSVSQKFAKYWICRARLMEQEGDLNVLPMFEEAVRVVLEPVDELRTVVFDILKKKDEIRENEKQEDTYPSAENSPDGGSNPLTTPKPVRALIIGERGGSSVVKYKITTTPGGPPSQQRQPVRLNGQEVRFFTPVRRSVRIESASLRYPASLQDHDVCVASYNDLISEEEDDTGSDERKSRGDFPSVNDTPMYVYRQNEALGDKVSVRLVRDDSL